MFFFRIQPLPRCVFASCVVASVVGCAGLAEKNYRITGEARLYQVDTLEERFPVRGRGELHFAHDIPSKGVGSERPAFEYYYAVPDSGPKEQNICILLNRCFMKNLEETGKPEVLAYVEVEDGVGSKPLKNVFFRDDYQPAGALFNFQDAIVYGPTTFSGKPIKIRFYVYELDREENKVASAVVDTLAGTVKQVGGPYGLVADLVGDLVKTLISTNVDDREFYHEITLSPVPFGAQTPPANVTALRTGSYVIVKKEIGRRVSPDQLWEFKDELDFAIDADGDKKADDVPSIICRSGELFLHRVADDFVYKLAAKKAASTMQGLLSKYEQAKGKKDKEQQEATLRKMQDTAEKALQNIKPIYRSKSVIPPEHKAAKKLGEFTPNSPTSATESGKPDPISPKNLVDLAQYTSYRSKSYLTFSIVDHLPPIDAEALNEVYKSSAEQIEQTLNANVDMESLAKSIRDSQKKASDAIVAIIAARTMAKVKDPAKIDEVQKQLKEKYKGSEDAIDLAARNAKADVEIRKITNPVESGLQAEILKTFGGDALTNLLGLDEAGMKKLEDAFKNPSLESMWPFARKAIETARAFKEIKIQVDPSTVKKNVGNQPAGGNPNSTPNP